MNDPAQLWADPRLVYTVAAAAVALLLITIWLFRRRHRQGRQAGVVCLIVSIALHAALLFLVPLVMEPQGGSSTVAEKPETAPGIDAVSFSTFDPDMTTADASAQSQESTIAPLPVANLTELLQPTPMPEQEAEPEPPEAEPPTDEAEPETVDDAVPESLAEMPVTPEFDSMSEIDSQLGDLLDAAFAADEPEPTETPAPAQAIAATPPADASPQPERDSNPATAASTVAAPATTVPGALQNDFANRRGQAKTEALMQTGGDANTEAAVEAALRFLVDAQRPDGAWDPRASGAGRERSPLGTSRGGAGSRAETAITGLALLTLMGAGHTHHQGEYADNVYRGLAYLIRSQQPNGSLAGNASVYASTYSHGMASLAMCEAAAITRDPSAIQSARRAVAHTRRLQHPTTGGWRYTEGDPGDLSQLGWQAMVLDAGHRAEISVDRRAVAGVAKFLRSVRAGTYGGLAGYRPRERPSRTMTAEALATRLLLGEQVPAAEVAEAERYLLQQPPGVGQDNYYYWYYATLALHQLQDDAWERWNESLKQRLLVTQRADGSWGTESLWGGYGGTVYTTSMAALCLESYYRHAIRGDQERVADGNNPQNSTR